MKLKDLIPKLQALNPEAEVWADGRGGWESEGPGEVIRLLAGTKELDSFGDPYVLTSKAEPTPSDTLIVLSE